MNSHSHIEKLATDITNTLFTADPVYDYFEITEAFIELALKINEADSEETEDIWYIGENSYCMLMDLIPAAYWHYTEWHGGQASKSYEALCTLGTIYTPNLEQPPQSEEDSGYDVYTLLDKMAEEAKPHG